MAILIGNMMINHQTFRYSIFRHFRIAKGACASQSHLQSCRPPRHIAWPWNRAVDRAIRGNTGNPQIWHTMAVDDEVLEVLTTRSKYQGPKLPKLPIASKTTKNHTFQSFQPIIHFRHRPPRHTSPLQKWHPSETSRRSLPRWRREAAASSWDGRSGGNQLVNSLQDW